MEEPEYEQRLNDMFCEAFETNHPAMHDWVLIKMELRSLRNDAKKEENDGLGKIRKHPEKQQPAERESGRGLPESRDGSKRQDCKIKACCLICARGELEDGTVLCTYSKEAYREGWYCGLFMLRDIETE